MVQHCSLPGIIHQYYVSICTRYYILLFYSHGMFRVFVLLVLAAFSRYVGVYYHTVHRLRAMILVPPVSQSEPRSILYQVSLCDKHSGRTVGVLSACCLQNTKTNVFFCLVSLKQRYQMSLWEKKGFVQKTIQYTLPYRFAVSWWPPSLQYVVETKIRGLKAET